jgi:hypothetical protein
MYFCNLCIFIVRSTYSYYSTTLTEGFPCFFLSCTANARVQLTKTGHGPHCSNLFLCWSMYFFVLFYVFFFSFCVLFVCKCVLLPPGVNPIAVNKYIIPYQYSLAPVTKLLPNLLAPTISEVIQQLLAQSVAALHHEITVCAPHSTSDLVWPTGI